MTEGPIVDDDQIEIVAGRRAPFTQLADWVALSGASDHAKALFWHLKMHVNVERGDAEVWPGKEVLAHWMRLSRGSKIDPYLKELIALGAIDVIRRRYANGLRTRNRYVIHDLPPNGYDGPTSLAEWYARHPEFTSVGKGETAGQPVVPSGGPRSRANTRPDSKTAGQPVVPSRGPRSPVQGTSVVPPRGVEQDEVQLENPPPPRRPKSQSSHAHGGKEEEASATPETGSDGRAAVRSEAERLVDEAASRWVGHRLPTRKERLRLAERACEALAGGASPDGILHGLTRDLAPGQADCAVAVVMARTADPGWAALPVPAPRQPQERSAYRPRCGDPRHNQAAPGYDRFLYDPDGQIVGQCECARPVAGREAVSA